ncbi:MAG: heterodisulfide reductase-related iron-sulfur binding cluster, partial [Vulcanimicrobiaceae bacterium]
MKRYGFFPGCVAKESCIELFNSTLLLADKLGIELVELTAASCCGASVLNDVNRDVARVLNARTY